MKKKLLYWRKNPKGIKEKESYRNWYAFMAKNAPIYNQFSKKEEKLATAIGYEVLGPLLYGFSRWLYAQIREDQVEKIFFLSREGKLLMDSFRLLYPDFGLQASYLYVSRRAVIVPMLAQCSCYREFIRITGSCLRYLKVSELWELCFPEYQAEYLMKLSESGLKADSLSYELNDVEGDILFKIIREIGEGYFCQQEGLFEQYLSQENFRGKVAVVDIGWQGTMQWLLQEKMKFSGTEIYGYYLGIIDKNSKMFYRQIKRKGYAFTQTWNKEYLCGFMDATFFVENLFMNPQGTVKAYRQYEDGIVPIFREQEQGSEMTSVIQMIQREAKKFLKLAGVSEKTEMPLDIAVSPYMRMACYPQMQIINLFQSMRSIDVTECKWLPQNPFCYYLLHLPELKRELAENSNRIFFLKKLCRIPLPYHKVLGFARMLGMKSQYVKKTYKE